MEINNNNKKFVAGFNLVGQRRSDGKIYSYSSDNGVLDFWPDAIEEFGNTYVLEDVVGGSDGYEEAVYV